MPGDGIGNDVLEASRAILDVADFNAEYIPLDIGFKIFEGCGIYVYHRFCDFLDNLNKFCIAHE